MLCSLIQNRVLMAALIAWTLGQFLKAPLEYLLNKRWNWGIMLSPGGMPSSHSSLVTAVTLAIGFQEGFSSSLFALSFAISMIVIYDAAGVRRQAGIHAERINELMKSFFENRTIPEKELKEVLGHTPFEVITGVMLGIVTSVAFFWLFPISQATWC